VGKKYTQDIKRIIIPVDNSETSRNVALTPNSLAKNAPRRATFLEVSELSTGIIIRLISCVYFFPTYLGMFDQ
jgi:hypothetical protein